MRLPLLSTLGVLAALAAIVAVPASGQSGSEPTANYAVVLAQPPAAAYEGTIAGYARTKPAKGNKYNSKSAAARRYTERLVQQHEQFLDEVGGDETIYDYTLR